VPTDYFGEDVAEHFDRRYAHLENGAIVDPMVDFIAGFADGGAALELGVGTGRIALPLAARGIQVHGIDLSEAMISRLRAKPGGDKISVTVGDIAPTSVQGVFSVAYIVANTIMNLTTQDEQVACFEKVAGHLDTHGYFVMEVLVPRLQWLPPGETYQPFAVTESHLGFDEFDVVRQRVISHHYWIDGDHVEVHSPPFRYVWPSELDLMARIAGMTLRERWSSWNREPFDADSDKHVSVWQKS
jgi:SAM-dependent methyltransferase